MKLYKKESVNTLFVVWCGLLFYSCMANDLQRKLIKAAGDNNVECVRTLLSSNAPVNVKHDNNIWPPLIHALCNEQKNYAVVQLLLQHGARVHTKTRCLFAWTPIMYAIHSIADRECAPIVGLLVDFHANVNVRDDFGKTPLMLAVQLNKKQVVQCLLDLRADIHKKMYNKKSAIDFSREQSSIYQLLSHNSLDAIRLLCTQTWPKRVKHRSQQTSSLFVHLRNRQEGSWQ